jgi:hypothetical protein
MNGKLMKIFKIPTAKISKEINLYFLGLGASKSILMKIFKIPTAEISMKSMTIL